MSDDVSKILTLAPTPTLVKLPLLISTRRLGLGGFGSIYPVLGQNYVLKLMRKTTNEDKYAFFASELSKICPNFAITLKIFDIQDPFILRSFLVGKATLYDVPIRGHVIEKLEMVELKKWNLNYFKQALIAIITLNENNIFHNDAHPGNFLIKKDKKQINVSYIFKGYDPIVLKSEGIIKMCDFGMTSTESTLFSDPQRLNAIEKHKLVFVPGVFNSVSDSHHLCQRLPSKLVSPFISHMADVWSKIAIDALKYREKTTRLYALQTEELINIIRFIVRDEQTCDPKVVMYDPCGAWTYHMPTYCAKDGQQYCIELVQYRINKYDIKFSKAYTRIPEFYGSSVDKRKSSRSRIKRRRNSVSRFIKDTKKGKRRRDLDDIGPSNIKRNIKISPIYLI